MRSYRFEIPEGPVCSILPNGDLSWTIYFDDNNILTSDGPQACITMLYDGLADIPNYESWQKHIPPNLDQWEIVDDE